MQVLHVCSEMFPLLKTGGLADVIGALPAAQIADGVDARVLLPAFPDIRRGVTDAQVVSRRDTFAGHITLLFGHYNGVGIYLIDAPHLYDRPGSPYHDTNLFAYTDNVLRFALLGWVGAEMASGLDPFWRPDVVHAHDWHAGLAPAYLAARGRPAKSVFTVHNLAYQGMFYAHHMNDIQLPWSFFNIHGLEFNGQISFLKAGLYYADHITAVSPTYAREITEPQFAYFWSRAGSWRYSARAIRCCRKVSLRRQRNTPARWAFRLAITKHFRIALWAARTSFWCPAVLNRAA